MIQPRSVKIGSRVLYQVPGLVRRFMFVTGEEWNEVSRTSLLVCDWSDEDGTVHEGRFELEALDLAPP